MAFNFIRYNYLAIFILTNLALLFISPTHASNISKREYVIVLHGVARSSSSMDKVAKSISAHSDKFEVYNIDYESTNNSFTELVDKLNDDLQKILVDKNKKVNFVGYSMGSLMIRYYIQKYKPNNLGRVVMLAPPNKGSEAADFFKDNILFKEIFGEAGQKMGTKKDSITHKLKDADYELGIIAGDRSIDPISSFVIPGPDDGKVAIDKTKIKGMKEHIVLHTSHTFIIYNDEAIRQTIYFLKNGKFDNADNKK